MNPERGSAWDRVRIDDELPHQTTRSILPALRFLEELVPSFTLGVSGVLDFDPIRSRVVAAVTVLCHNTRARCSNLPLEKVPPGGVVAITIPFLLCDNSTSD